MGLDRTGEDIVLTAGAWANGGHTVARTDEGRVVFVRHAETGERVRVRLTEAGPDASFWRGDVVEVLEPAPHRRRRHPWPAADAVAAAQRGVPPVGGAELGHLELERQREIKTGILRELLGGIGGFGSEELDRLHPVVRALPGEDSDGLGWRTRAHFTVDDAGRPAMHPHRSDQAIAVTGFPLMVPALERLRLWELDFTGAQRIDLAVSASSPADAAGSGEGGDGGQGSRPPLVVVTPREFPTPEEAHRACATLRDHLQSTVLPHLEAESPGTSVVLAAAPGERTGPEVLAGEPAVTERAGGYSWRVSAGGFWQIHRAAPAVLLEAVTDAARAEEGQFAVDLYSGAGLFTAGLAEAVGESGRVLAVEGSPVTSADAAATFAGHGQVEIVRGSVEGVLGRRWPGSVPGGPGARRGGRRGSGGSGPRRRDARGTRSKLGEGPARQVTDTGRSPDVVVLDPPRAGAGKRVVDALATIGARRIVYLSCDPATLARDLARFRGHGWRVESLEAFDLYPNTHHMETLVSLTL